MPARARKTPTKAPAKAAAKTPAKRAPRPRSRPVKAVPSDLPPIHALGPQLIALSALKPDRRNANKHGERNLSVIERSLRRFGQVKPIVTDSKRNIVAGNGTYIVAERIGMPELAVVVFPGNRNEARAYAIADNRSAELSEWDDPELLAQIEAMNSELREAAGFDDVETDDLRAAVAKLEAAAGGQYGAPEFPGQLPQAGLNTLGDRYAEKATRTLFFEYDNATFTWLTDRLAEYREANGLESNAEAIVGMVGDVSGTKPPTP